MCIISKSLKFMDAQNTVFAQSKRLEMLQDVPQTPKQESNRAIKDVHIAHACIGVFDPTGVLPPGVAESVPPVLFFFFFFRDIRAGGFDCAARSDR